MAVSESQHDLAATACPDCTKEQGAFMIKIQHIMIQQSGNDRWRENSTACAMHTAPAPAPPRQTRELTNKDRQEEKNELMRWSATSNRTSQGTVPRGCGAVRLAGVGRQYAGWPPPTSGDLGLLDVE